MSFDEIAPMVDRSPAAARQLASRARRRVREAPRPDVDLARQREVVAAFHAASRAGDLDGLVAVLDPDVVLRADHGAAGGGLRVVRGARTVAGQALMFAHLAPYARPAIVNGAAGMVTVPPDGPVSVLAFSIRDGRIAEIDVIADPERTPALIPE
jgi:RNA polymerase sigma-70 factor (ECF subfamily)